MDAQACRQVARRMAVHRALPRAALSLSILLAAGLGLASPAVQAQTWPVKPVRIISPYPPGGGNDILSRAIAQKLGPQLGVQVFVENKPGANSIIGTEILAKSPPDGYSIILVPSSHAINQSLYPKMPYDAVRDFAPVTLAGSTPVLLGVGAATPVNNLREFITMAQARPAPLTYSTAGNGSSGHLAAVLLALTAGIRLQHVPYKGTAPAVTALLGGEVDIASVPPTTLLPHIRSGKVKPVGMGSAQRSPAAPDIPTLAEQGLAGFEASVWYGLLAPANTPRPVVQRLNGGIHAVLKEAEVRKLLADQGIDPLTSTPEEFARLIASDLEKWARVVKESGARVE